MPALHAASNSVVGSCFISAPVAQLGIVPVEILVAVSLHLTSARPLRISFEISVEASLVPIALAFCATAEPEPCGHQGLPPAWAVPGPTESTVNSRALSQKAGQPCVLSQCRKPCTPVPGRSVPSWASGSVSGGATLQISEMLLRPFPRCLED